MGFMQTETSNTKNIEATNNQSGQITALVTTAINASRDAPICNMRNWRL